MMLPESFVKKLLKYWLDIAADGRDQRTFMIGLLYGCIASWLGFVAIIYLTGCGA